MKKHILCFGDSNTHGYCAEPWDTEDGGSRFTENERWTCLLQKALGDEYLVIEEGLGGRTTAFRDPATEGLSGLDYIYPCMKSHAPLDLVIVMLGTNDTKERFSANAAFIGACMERLVKKIKQTNAWDGKEPNVLVIAPPHLLENFDCVAMGGYSCVVKSREVAKYYEQICKNQSCAFLDAEGIAEFNKTDATHLTKKGHAALAAKLAEIVPTLL